MQRLLCGGLIALSLSAQAYAAPLDFETAGQFDANFAKLMPGIGTMSQTSNGAAADFVRKFGANTGALATVAAYDQTPTDRTTVNVFASGFSVTLDAKFSQAGQSLGVYAVNPADDTKGLLALFNVDDPSLSGADRIRFWSGTNPKTGSTSSTLSGDFNGTSPFTATATGFSSITFTYGVDTVDATKAVMTVTAGSFTQSSTFATGTAIANPQLAFRVYGGTADTATLDIDNVDIPASTVLNVPEPASASLLMVVGGLLLARRRRDR